MANRAPDTWRSATRERPSRNVRPCSTDKLAAAGITDVGRQRDNEDRFVVAHGGRLVAVADGMGGHNAGEAAAALR